MWSIYICVYVNIYISNIVYVAAIYFNAYILCSSASFISNCILMRQIKMLERKLMGINHRL